jgi:hypothetical protein
LLLTLALTHRGGSVQLQTDYAIVPGFRLGALRLRVPLSRYTEVLGAAQLVASWRTTWGSGQVYHWPRRGVNAKTCAGSTSVIEVNVYVPRLGREDFEALIPEIGRYKIDEQVGLRTPSFLMWGFYGEPDEQSIVPTQLGATRTRMYWYSAGLHIEVESGEVVEIEPVATPPRCP